MQEAVKAGALALAWIAALAVAMQLFLPIPITWAQQATVYDPTTCKAVGHIATDSAGTKTFYDANGRAVLKVTKPYVVPQKEKTNGK